MRRAVYAGSFDPITNGHMWMIKQGASLFDELVVAIGVNPDKKCTFSLDDRIEMLNEVAHDGVRVSQFENTFLVDYASAINAKYILRGIRTGSDYEYERGMRHINDDLKSSDIVTIFLIPPREIAEVSSSLVKGLIGPKGWKRVIRNYVPCAVYNKILAMRGVSPDDPCPECGMELYSAAGGGVKCSNSKCDYWFCF